MITTREQAAAIAADALDEAAPVWEVLAIRYGTRLTTRSGVYLDYGALGESDGPLRMDYFFWLLRGDAGTILVDTGFDAVVGERRGRTTLCPPLEALGSLGVTEAEVNRVVLTHLHYDHTGNLGSFPSTELLVPARDLHFWTGPGTEPFAGPIERSEIEHVAAAVASHRGLLLEEGGEIAPGIGAIVVGGHSPGQISLIVKGVEQPVLLASDAIHYYEEAERGLPFDIFVDLDEMVAGYGLLQELCARTGAVLVPGHDPEVAERFPSSDGVVLRLG